jgi:hypothetical protein
LRFEISHELVLRRIKSCPSTQRINGFESGRGNQPWSRVAGYSTPRPQAQRSRKGFVHRLLGKIKIVEQADQSRQDASRINAIKGVEQSAYLLSYLFGGTLEHDDDRSKPATLNATTVTNHGDVKFRINRWAIFYARDRLAEEKFHCRLFGKIKQIVDEYAKGYEERFAEIAKSQATSSCVSLSPGARTSRPHWWQPRTSHELALKICRLAAIVGPSGTKCL